MRVELSDLKLGQQVVVQRQAQEKALEGMKRDLQEELRQQEEKVRNPEQLQKLIEEIEKKFDMLSKYLKIDIDSELEIPVIKIIEKETNRVIRQIPPDYILDLMKKIDQMLGILLSKEA